ncbi:MAG: formate dehydrogenase accessory sulfurtransferase FdhD [Deltaproteobacteria bacterium]|nr:formate dehydrogenase accessory sulfurtransferase FdhD [Deltaproteobacteria bacterium]MBW2048384.1 formate dehydrogenase accessory sulfurtransferase FdhD [Deltaproteobacteria bacterium]MBW2110988.1 formate dehydrogenase accessory sulfurtransferase FdhD [Deltaproteobacteria bacterium]MBW2354206.1 formate dehydrogenase accessory sulfurtransferase FdhD [Deltaproteobacteria bacterium]HDZ90804.1 formate dehydrogenase accessory sulfurtransferase FdhD [Deltaproteobacteria bacterium]
MSDFYETYLTFRSFAMDGDRISRQKTDLMAEIPLQIIINDQRHTLIMFTPNKIRELVVGFVFTEGLIGAFEEVKACTISKVRHKDGEEMIEARMEIASRGLSSSMVTGRRISYSSCGICGTEGYNQMKGGLRRLKSTHRFSMNMLKALPDKLKHYQPLYTRTGGAHAAVLFNSRGEEVIHCEDMGRHNALDKVIGSALIKGVSPEDKVLLSSGRASLEMILKTARAGFPLFLALSRPTSRAVEAARFYNITLMDMARKTNRIYTHVRRIKGY